MVHLWHNNLNEFFHERYPSQKLIEEEKKRQKSVINLIASENYVSKDVLEALGSRTDQQIRRRYPGKRYYGGIVLSTR